MFFNARPPQGSYGVPVHINLQGTRRRQTRDVFHPATMQEPHCGGERARAQALVCSVGEDRAVLLGFAMMTFSILMYFVVGITLVKPYFHSDWGVEANCSLIQTEFLSKWADCRGLTTYPCLQVFVNITPSGRKARLRHDEEAVNLSPECFYTPTCQRDKTELVQEAEKIKQTLDSRQETGKSLACFLSHRRYPEDAILYRNYTEELALWHLLWPSLMLFGGILLVGLVKLNQRLAHLCTELSREDGEGKQTALVQGRLYQLLRWRPGSPTVQDDSMT